ncbi:MAG: acetolactate synthase small subunit [Elusimicrobiota bacterium]
MRRTISALVENKPGVLARIATLFAARGFNIDSLVVGETEDPSLSRMTIIVRGDDRILEQVEKQLNKLIDVVKVMDFSAVDHIERDLALVKVKIDKNTRFEVLQTADIFRAKIIDVGQETVIVEVTGDEDKIKAFLDLVKPYGIKELVRTGVVAVARGSNPAGGSTVKKSVEHK